MLEIPKHLSTLKGLITFKVKILKYYNGQSAGNQNNFFMSRILRDYTHDIFNLKKKGLKDNYIVQS